MKIPRFIDPDTPQITKQIHILEERLGEPGIFGIFHVERETRLLIARYKLDMEQDYVERSDFLPTAESITYELGLHCYALGGRCCKGHRSFSGDNGPLIPIDDSSGIPEEGLEMSDESFTIRSLDDRCFFQEAGGACTIYESRPLYCAMFPVELFAVFGQATYGRRFYSSLKIVIMGCCATAPLQEPIIKDVKRRSAAVFVSAPRYMAAIRNMAIDHQEQFIRREAKIMY